MKVLILCNDFPPLNSIGAQRPYSWYRHLHEFGIEPVVVTKNWRGHSSTPLDVLRNATDDRRTVVEQDERGTIIRVPFEVTPSEKLLMTYGPDRHWLSRKALTFSYRVASFLHSRFDPHRGILDAADNFLASNNVDGIIATGEPFLLFRYCYLLHKKYRIPWLADYRDGWQLNYVLGQSKEPLRRALLRWEALFENKYLQTAAGIVTIDPELGAALAAVHRKPVSVVYNGFDGFYDGPREPLRGGIPLVLNHTGTLTPGQRVESLLEAVRQLLNEKAIDPSELQLQFIGLDYFPEQSRRVKTYDKAVAACVYTTPRVPREDVLRINTGADFLVTFTEEKHSMINAKTYDYLAVKRPVLVVPGDNGLLSGLVEKLQAGHSLDSVQSLKEFLQNAVARKRAGQLIPPPPLRENDALFYTRRNQAARLADALRRAWAS